VSDHDQGEGQGYNLSDPQMPFCLGDRGARSLGSYTGDLEARMRGSHACELRELDLARDMAHRLRTELIYGMPAEAQIYDERDVPTSRNLPMFMGFVFEVLTGKEDPGALLE
jgi:hypothetical protein